MLLMSVIMAKVIPVLFTAANHLTPAHVTILNAAADVLNDMDFAVGTPLISPVGDAYIGTKKYHPVIIDGVQHARIRFSGEERAAIAEATVADFNSDNIKILDYEITHSSVPKGDQERGFIEHWEMLEYLQRKEIARGKKDKDEPALYVLVGGADLANAMTNWKPGPGLPFLPNMPFLIATRTMANNTIELQHTDNRGCNPEPYLTALGCQTQAFNQFTSGSFGLADSPHSSLSSTALANCKSEALNMMGDKGFTVLVKILKQRANQSPCEDEAEEAQRQTAIATLTVYKKYAYQGKFSDAKKDIVNGNYPPSYQKLWDQPTEPLEKIRALLDDYTKSNSAPNRFFHGHWNRHYVAAVADIVKMIDDGETNITKVRDELAKIKPTNLEGSLARRMDFIAKELGPIDRNQASDFEHPSPTA